MIHRHDDFVGFTLDVFDAGRGQLALNEIGRESVSWVPGQPRTVRGQRRNRLAQPPLTCALPDRHIQTRKQKRGTDQRDVNWFLHYLRVQIQKMWLPTIPDR